MAVSESKASWVISLFVPQNENYATSLVKFPLFMTFLTNQDVVVYTFENITQDALYSETANCVAQITIHCRKEEISTFYFMFKRILTDDF